MNFKKILRQRKNIFLVLIILLAIFLRFYQLDKIPGEIFGDMAENHEHIDSILHGDFKIIYGYDGREAMLFYLAAPFAYFLGNTYLTLKIVVALIGVGGVYACYLFAKECINEEVGLLTAFLVAVSKWSLSFSRIGFRCILTPLFVALIFYFFIKAYRHHKTSNFVLTGLFLGLGLYTYTAFRLAIPAMILIFMIFIFIERNFILTNIKKIIALWITFFIIVLPMIIDFIRQPAAYFAHPGPMLSVEPGNIWQYVLLENIFHELLMFHVKGDIVFRVNPKFDPMLDAISGVFFLIGIVFLLTKKYRTQAIFVFIPFIILQFASLLVLHSPIDIPSATRTIGIIPFVYFLIAIGIWWVLKRIKITYMYNIFLLIILGSIFTINFHKYFYVYAEGLPNHNVPFGRVIAEAIDKLPSSTEVYVVGSSWGEWQQPEPRGIFYALGMPRQITFLPEITYTCDAVKNTNNEIYMVLSPTMQTRLSEAVSCFSNVENIEAHKSKYGEMIFYSVKGYKLQ